MAVKKKGARKIVVEGHEFRWRATGNDGWISLVVWPAETEACLIVGKMDYHERRIEIKPGVFRAQSQAVITNRIVRAVILKLGVDQIMSTRGHWEIGDLSDYFDMENAVRAQPS